jgi:bifunctional UDP-N-acetylglucosamine pyrophosphorylase/glucosamine-1-phosphate N-acetyltransferase
VRVARLLLVPAAGLGSRLGAGAPKLLVPVAGRPMIGWLLELYRPHVERFAVVVHPSALEVTAGSLAKAPLPIDFFVQREPTGMLDAILIARPAVERHRPDRVWITWCDQVAIHPATLAHLAQEDRSSPAPALVLPTCRGASPYVHFERDSGGRITRVLHRREGDPMPDVGESDTGLFDLSRETFTDLLPQYAREVRPASATRERNFVPFVAWAAARTRVVTFPCTEPEEAIGVNTPQELERIETHLQRRT